MTVIALHIYRVVGRFAAGLSVSKKCLFNGHQRRLPWCSMHSIQETPPRIAINAGTQQGTQAFVCLVEVYASNGLRQ